MNNLYVRPMRCAIVALGMALLASSFALAEGSRRVCVIVPHFKDEYWLSVGFGLQQAASEAGAELLIHESGGYRGLERQVELLDRCRKLGTDAVLIGAVSADATPLLEAIAETTKEQPVLALVNALDAPNLAGRVGVDWQDMGRAVGEFLSSRHPFGSPPVRAVLVTGLAKSGAGPVLVDGLHEGLGNASVEVVGIYRADTGLREQLREVEQAFAHYPDVDYLIGSAPAIEGAMALIRRLPEGAHRPELVAYYVSHSVLRGMKRGQVSMAPFDDPIAQGRMGLEMALRATRGVSSPELRGPQILSVTPEAGNVGEISLSPAGFFPDLQ